MSRLCRYIAAIVVAIFALVAHDRGSAQIFPSFPSPIYQSSITIDQGISAAQVPNSQYGTALMSVYATSTRFAYAVAPDGQNNVFSSAVIGLPTVNCNAATPSTCSATVAYFNNTIYAAYSDQNTHGLNVAIATPVQGVGYSWSLVYQDTSVKLVTAPAMSINPQGNRLIIMYGTSSEPYTKNQFFESTIDTNGNITQASEGGNLYQLRLSSVSKPSMAVLNGTLWLCSQQNGSNHQLYIYNSSDGINWNYVEVFSNLALGGGASMVNFNGNLVLANQQNNSNRALFVFSSPDGTNWYAQEYGSIRMGGDPALALFNGGISLAFRANDSGAALYGSFATH